MEYGVKIDYDLSVLHGAYKVPEEALAILHRISYSLEQIGPTRLLNRSTTDSAFVIDTLIEKLRVEHELEVTIGTPAGGEDVYVTPEDMARAMKEFDRGWPPTIYVRPVRNKDESEVIEVDGIVLNRNRLED